MQSSSEDGSKRKRRPAKNVFILSVAWVIVSGAALVAGRDLVVAFVLSLGAAGASGFYLLANAIPLRWKAIISMFIAVAVTIIAWLLVEQYRV